MADGGLAAFRRSIGRSGRSLGAILSAHIDKRRRSDCRTAACSFGRRSRFPRRSNARSMRWGLFAAWCRPTRSTTCSSPRGARCAAAHTGLADRARVDRAWSPHPPTARPSFAALSNGCSVDNAFAIYRPGLLTARLSARSLTAHSSGHIEQESLSADGSCAIQKVRSRSQPVFRNPTVGNRSNRVIS